MNTPDTSPNESNPPWLELAEHQVNSLHFGSVRIHVQDSQVVEIETTEKLRFDRQFPKSAR